ncbi:MAG: hypothetical protein ACYC46_15895 [Acidobacteriaceae bacterium]
MANQYLDVNGNLRPPAFTKGGYNYYLILTFTHVVPDNGGYLISLESVYALYLTTLSSSAVNSQPPASIDRILTSPQWSASAPVSTTTPAPQVLTAACPGGQGASFPLSEVSITGFDPDCWLYYGSVPGSTGCPPIPVWAPSQTSSEWTSVPPERNSAAAFDLYQFPLSGTTPKWVAVGDGIFISLNYGVKWRKVQDWTTTPINAFYATPALLIGFLQNGMDLTVVQSTNDGAFWTTVGTLSGAYMQPAQRRTSPYNYTTQTPSWATQVVEDGVLPDRTYGPTVGVSTANPAICGCIVTTGYGTSAQSAAFLGFSIQNGVAIPMGLISTIPTLEIPAVSTAPSPLTDSLAWGVCGGGVGGAAGAVLPEYGYGIAPGGSQIIPSVGTSGVMRANNTNTHAWIKRDGSVWTAPYRTMASAKSNNYTGSLRPTQIAYTEAAVGFFEARNAYGTTGVFLYVMGASGSIYRIGNTTSVGALPGPVVFCLRVVEVVVWQNNAVYATGAAYYAGGQGVVYRYSQPRYLKTIVTTHYTIVEYTNGDWIPVALEKVMPGALGTTLLLEEMIQTYGNPLEIFLPANPTPAQLGMANNLDSI